MPGTIPAADPIMTDDRDNAIIDAILAGGIKLPPMPSALLSLERLAANPDASLRQFAVLIARDPALTGAVFRVAGSPVFGLRSKVDSLDKALTVLGLSTTLAVIHGESLRHALNDPREAVLMSMLWRRMTMISGFMLASTKLLRLPGVRLDQAFMLGTFHDCGVAILCRRYATYAQAFIGGGWPDLLVLDATHHSSHGVVGHMVARNWQLPEELGLAIRHHHDAEPPDLSVAVMSLIALLQFAFHLLHRRTQAEDPEWELWAPRCMALFRMDASRLAEFEDEVLEKA